MEVDIDDDVVEVVYKIAGVDHIVVLKVGIVDALVELVDNFVVDNKVVDAPLVQSRVFVVDGKDS